MKAFLAHQLNPAKTMKQLIVDRCLFRLAVVSWLTFAWCI